MINHERKRFNFFGAREMQTSSIPVVEEGRKLFLERQLKALARVWTRSNLGKAWNELRKLVRKKREREREREVKRETRFPSPLPPPFSDYPISCSTIRAAGRKLLNYCRLTDRFFRVALISRRKEGSRRRGERLFLSLIRGEALTRNRIDFFRIESRRSIPPVTSLPTEPITPRSTAKRNQFVSPLVPPLPSFIPSNVEFP